jgi:hypothetical protein
MSDSTLISRNEAGIRGGGVYLNTSSTFRISGGTIAGDYGSNPDANRADDSGTALWVESGTAEYGSTTWTTIQLTGPYGKDRNDTIRVVDGNLE